MKRLLTSFLTVAIFCSTTFAADLNPFAYNLYTTTTSNGETDLHFSTNAKSKKIDIYLNVGGTWKRLPREYEGRGANSYHTVVSESDISALGLAYGQSYTWKVVVTPYDRSNVEYVEDKRVDMPAFSVDVDNNPQSKHFGRILVSNGTNQLGNNTHGIYEYAPTLELIQNYNGGLSNSTSDWYDNQHLSPYRIRIAQDGSGRIFATNYDVDKSVYLWQINPDNLSSWTQIISRTAATSMVGKDQYEKQNTLPVYNIGLDLKTNGNTYQFLLLSASREKETVFTYGNAYCGIYTIPNINTPGTGSYERIDIPKVSSNCEIRNIISNAISSNAQFDKNGNVWYCGNSSYSGNTTKAGLVHQVVSSGDRKENYNSVLDFHRYTVASGGIRHHYNSADNRVVIAQGGTKTSESGRADVIASIYTVDNSLHPVLTRVGDLKVPEKNDNLWYVVDFAWDYANNIYACVRNASATYRGVHVFATDLNETPIETPCKNSFVLSKGHDLNPYAYDLSAEWHNDTKILSVNFTLNAAPNMDENAGPKGIQIYAIDKNENRYLIYQVPTATITSAANGMRGPYSIDVPFEVLKGDDAVYRDQHGTPIPKDLLTWEVTVCGRSNDNKYSGKTTTPEVVKYTIDNRPNRVHGVAINNYENSPEFGQMYVTEGIQSQPANDTKGRWTWLSGKFPSLLSYTPQLAYEAFYKNGFSDPDPHRVRVSDDGRVFVSSHLWEGETAVWEFKDGTYTPIIESIPEDWRVMSIDVKGSGSELKMLVCYFDKTKIGSNMTKGLVCREYNIGSVSSVNADTGTEKAICPDYKTGNSSYGLMYQAVYDINSTGHPLKAAASQWDFSKAGLASAVYDSNNMIWMKVDFFANKTINSHIVAFNSSSTNPLTRTLIPLETELYYGGGGILVKGDTLITGNNCAIDFYRINTSTGAVSHINRISTNADGELFTNIWVNDISIDHAQNVYVASAWAGNIMVLALPYDGHTTTRAPQKAENQFMLGTPVTWHPYHCPVTEMRTSDLWLMFMDGYNEWYTSDEASIKINTERAAQDITNAKVFMSPPGHTDGLIEEFLTHSNSPWKWLGDYIIATMQPVGVSTNEELWEIFKTYFNQYYPSNSGDCVGVTFPRADQPIENVASFWPSKSDGTQQVDSKSNIMTNSNSSFKWLGDYILKVASEQTHTITTEVQWRFNLSSFFNADHRTSYPVTADFTEAGKPENWGAYYVALDGSTTLENETAWKNAVYDFFNRNDRFDISSIAPTGWYDEWVGSNFQTYMVTGEQIPYLKSDGYLLERWYYGSEDGFYYLDMSAQSGDYLFDEMVADGKTHLWARWLEATLSEGYSAELDQHALDIKSYNINTNEEVVSAAEMLCAQNEAVQLKVRRKLQGGMYNTMMLPFAIPEKAYLKKVTDGEGNFIFDEEKGGTMPSILVFDGSERTVINGEEVVQLNFHELGERPNNQDPVGREYESLFAYTPFLIMPAEDIVSPMSFWPAYVSSSVPVYSYTGDVTFNGQLCPDNISIPDGTIMLILVANNRLAKVTSSSAMQGLRGYFLMPESMSSLPARICVKESEETAVENVETEDGEQVYKVVDNQRVYIIRNQKKFDILGNFVQ